MAEGLEKRANEVPDQVEAENCKRMAKVFRESGRTTMLRISEVPEKK